MADVNEASVTDFMAGPPGSNDADNANNDKGQGTHWLQWNNLIARRIHPASRAEGSSGLLVSRRLVTSYLAHHLYFDNLSDAKVGGGRLTRETFSEICRRVNAAGTFSDEYATDLDTILQEFTSCVAQLPIGQRQLDASAWEHTSAQVSEDDAQDVLGDTGKWMAFLTFGMFGEHNEPGRAFAQFAGIASFVTTRAELVDPQHKAFLSFVHKEVLASDHRFEEAAPDDQARTVAHFFNSSVCQRELWTVPHDREAARRELSRRSAPAHDATKERLILTCLRTFPNLKKLLNKDASGTDLANYVTRIIAQRSPGVALTYELIEATNVDVGKLASQAPAAILADSNVAICNWLETAIRTLQSGIANPSASIEASTRGNGASTEVIDLDGFARRNPAMVAVVAALSADGNDPAKITAELLNYPQGCNLLLSKKSLNLEGFKSL